MSKPEKLTGGPLLRISSEVVRQIRQHARGSSKAEVCGVLIGRESKRVAIIDACISGANAAQGGAHVTFTQDTWEHIYKVKDRDYPEDRILGWYHSHPGFGVFLSDHDTFIHKNFFSSPYQIAWVYDPHSDEEGCFGWVGERLERLSDLTFFDNKGGEGAGETGKPEPSICDTGDSLGADAAQPDMVRDESSAYRLVGTIFSYLSVFLLGILIAWYVFPRVLVMPVPVDPQTGRPIMTSPSDDAGQSRSPQQLQTEHPQQSGPGAAKGSNDHRQ